MSRLQFMVFLSKKNGGTPEGQQLRFIPASSEGCCFSKVRLQQQRRRRIARFVLSKREARFHLHSEGERWIHPARVNRRRSPA